MLSLNNIHHRRDGNKVSIVPCIISHDLWRRTGDIRDVIQCPLANRCEMRGERCPVHWFAPTVCFIYSQSQATRPCVVVNQGEPPVILIGNRSSRISIVEVDYL